MINERQFNHLTEMGVTIYHKRTEPAQDEQVPYPFIEISSDEFDNMAIFRDILSSLSLTKGEISFAKNHIDLGLFNWSFHQHTALSFNDSLLISPPLVEMKQSSSLKRELWQIISNQIL
ncbi:DNA polymerase III subunit psi [Thalassotalea atypica]|uniref:DNA polymerase III subunit psi n=1 Tax=Thalassotalea atypica TaxID=2054316 RepID=UPI002573FA75|nr:DNA polymerase III subunit psi [Thalassotalea atypica]